MWKRAFAYSALGLVTLILVLAVGCAVVMKQGEGRIAPGVVFCGRDVSGMTREELTEVVEDLVPETVTELRCRFLPEMGAEIEAQVEELGKERNRTDHGTGEGTRSDAPREEEAETSLTVQGNELCFTIRTPMLRVDVEMAVEAVLDVSREVKAWEWLYEAVTGQAFRERGVQAVFVWDEKHFEEYLDVLRKVAEREGKEATVAWVDGRIRATESRRGFRLNTEQLRKDMEGVLTKAVERLQKEPMEALVLRFYVGCTVEAPKLSTEQAKACDTIVGEFVTSYVGAGGGRIQNIEVGAEKLHAKVILPGEEFSAAAALMPFTEANGYASGGTYIDGQLGESIGGGVCQLSTTVYNALLQTKLNITMRYAHSMPVGYVPLGLDAAIAGDYKDLRFANNTEVPVLLLCETSGEEVKVTLYGPEEMKRGEVTFESVVTEKTKEDTSGKITVEVYRTEIREDGKKVRERVSRDRYKER